MTVPQKIISLEPHLVANLEPTLGEFTDEKGRWRARDVDFMAGRWAALSKRIPTFIIEDFKATNTGPINPYIRTVVRLPVSLTEQRIPVGTVSNAYRLAQHAGVVEKCMEGLRLQQIDPSVLRCEVGLTPLGEWMNFRVYLPESFSYNPGDKQPLALRLECLNSVDGSSRLVILFSWLRLICSNGMTIRETKAELSDIHDGNLNLDIIPKIVSKGLENARLDTLRLQGWASSRVKIESVKFKKWVDGSLAKKWGKKAACRTLHICRSGNDVEFADPFEGGKPSERAVKIMRDVPGAPKPATNLYDVGQALSWIASRKNSVDERLEWQGTFRV